MEVQNNKKKIMITPNDKVKIIDCSKESRVQLHIFQFSRVIFSREEKASILGLYVDRGSSLDFTPTGVKQHE